jgi:hypothetical protein
MMKIIAVLTVVISSVSAFAPIAFNARTTSTKVSAVRDELGVIEPTGFFDPLKLGTDENFEQYRTAELKHGRVAQLAVIGYIVPEVFRFPGEIAPGLKFEDVPNGVAALNAIPALGWAQMFFLIGSVDYVRYNKLFCFILLVFLWNLYLGMVLLLFGLFFSSTLTHSPSLKTNQ